MRRLRKLIPGLIGCCLALPAAGSARDVVDLDPRAFVPGESSPPPQAAPAGGVVCARNRPDRGEERVGRRDDFVAGTDAFGHQGHDQGVRARRHAHAVGRAAVFRDGRFAFLHLRAQDKGLRLADVQDRRLDLGADLFVLRLQIQQRNFHRISL